MSNKKDAQEEIRIIEQNFAKMAMKKGIKAAFIHYAADDAILFRNNKLIKGKLEIEKYFQDPVWETIHLEWKPDLIEVSESEDLAYTYGKYNLIETNSAGTETISNGVFHTVWKKQANGSWKYVWD